MLDVEAGQRQALVDADELDAGFARVLQCGIGYFFIVQPPALFRRAESLAGVAFPRLDLQLLGLPVHVVHVGRTEVGRKQAVTDDAARGGQAVDLGARLDHVGRRQDVGVIRRRREARNHRHHRVAVEENLFDVVGQIEVFHPVRVALEIGVPALGDFAIAEQRQNLLAR